MNVNTNMSISVRRLLFLPLLMLLIMLPSGVARGDEETPPWKVEKGKTPQDRYVSDRFIFMGKFHQKPIIVSIAFNQGYSGRKRFTHVAEFNGHVLFSGMWHHLQNGNYLETDIPFPIEEPPNFEPCILKWKQKPYSGAINYDRQEISFLLQFRDIKTADVNGYMKDFRIETGIGEAFLQFQGEQIPGRLIYQHMDLAGYNRLANNFDHFNARSLQQFFLMGSDGDIFLIWCEQEGSKIRGQWLDNKRLVYLERGVNSVVRSSGDRAEMNPVAKNMTMDWTRTERDDNPDSQFPQFPTGWSITAKFPENPDGRNVFPQGEQMNFELFAGWYFYWFNRGMFTIEGSGAGEKLTGFGEIIRGE